MALLDANPKIKAAFLDEPNWLNLYGLPIRYEEREVNDHPQGFQVLRAQRTVFAIWNVPAPGTSLGAVVIQNVPDKIKRLSNVIIPDEAKHPSLERDLDQQFLDALDHIKRYSEDHGTNNFDWLTQQPWFTDGLDYREKALVVILNSLIPDDLDLFVSFNDSYIIHNSTTSLPIAGSLEFWVFSYSEFQSSNNLLLMLAEAARASESFMGIAFPTSDIIYLVVDANHSSMYHAIKWPTHVTVKITDAARKIPVDTIHHETFHYYLGGRTGYSWFNEGGANFMVAYVKDRMGKESLAERRIKIQEHVRRNCIAEFGLQTISELNHLFDDYLAEQNVFPLCVYNLGESFFLGLVDIIGEDALSMALAEIYGMAQSLGRTVTDEESYQVFLSRTPAGREDMVRDFYRRVHGGGVHCGRVGGNSSRIAGVGRDCFNRRAIGMGRESAGR